MNAWWGSYLADRSLLCCCRCCGCCRLLHFHLRDWGRLLQLGELSRRGLVRVFASRKQPGTLWERPGRSVSPFATVPPAALPASAPEVRRVPCGHWVEDRVPRHIQCLQRFQTGFAVQLYCRGERRTVRSAGTCRHMRRQPCGFLHVLHHA